MTNMTKEQIAQVMEELAQYSVMQAEIEQTLTELKEKVKAYMEEENITELLSGGHKCYYKEQTSQRFATNEFKKLYAELYASYCRPSVTKPFKFYI